MSRDRWKRDRWGTHPSSYRPREAIPLPKENRAQGLLGQQEGAAGPGPCGRGAAEGSVSRRAVGERARAGPPLRPPSQHRPAESLHQSLGCSTDYTADKQVSFVNPLNRLPSL